MSYKRHPIDGNVIKDGQGKSLFGFAKDNHPIPCEVNDPKTIKEFFKNFPYIPYRGTRHNTGHLELQFLNQMYLKSPTRHACINSKKAFLFGGKIDIIKSTSDVFAIDDEDSIADRDIKIRVANILSPKRYSKEPALVDYGKDGDLINFIHSLYIEVKKNGCGIIELVLTETLGQKKAFFRRHEQKNCLWDVSDGRTEPTDLAISYNWNRIVQEPPRVVKRYPEFTEEANGTRRTIIYVKNGSNKWYGEASDIAARINFYREYQDLLYLAKTANNDFTAKHIIETEAGQKGNRVIDNLRDQEYGGTKSRMDQAFTNQSDDPSSYLLMERPKGARPFEYAKVDANLNEGFYKAQREANMDTIIMAQNWSKELLGVDSGSVFNTKSLREQLDVKSVTNGRIEHDQIVDAVCLGAKEIFSFLGQDDLTDYGFKFLSPLEKLEGNNDIESPGS